MDIGPMTSLCTIEGSKLRHGDPLTGSTSHGVPMKWLRNHLDHIGDECLIWPFARDGRGYGSISVNRTISGAHRLMCEHRHGPPPTPKHEVAHSCGNGHLGCVNPSHLRWATSAENHADKLIHGTHNRGERNNQVKLSEADVRAIRTTSGITQSKIAERYGVGQQTISRIVGRKSWEWFT